MIPKDPFMLFSYVNMKLRDSFKTLDEFCSCEGVDKDYIIQTLAGAGFEYLPDINQFR